MAISPKNLDILDFFVCKNSIWMRTETLLVGQSSHSPSDLRTSTAQSVVL